MDDNELTADDENLEAEVLAEFNTWVNGQIAQERLKLYTVADLVASLYLRVRMHLVLEEGLKFMERVVNTVEHAIQSGELQVQFQDGGSFKYVSAEGFAEKPELRDMLLQATQEIDDTELDRWLTEGGL